MIEEGSRQVPPANLGELRVKLDQMTERITSRLKDRSRFPQNDPVYEPDAVRIAGCTGISLLQFAIEGLEVYHASLGRFDYADQFPVLSVKLPQSSVERTVGESPLQRLSISVNDNLFPFYRNLISKYCKHGDDPATYGETAYVDADLIQIVNERINIGRYVADVKERNDPSVFEARWDKELLLSKLRDKVREEDLIEKVRNTAQSYVLNPDMAEEAFRWIIERTIDVEIAYIQQANIPKTT